MQSVSGWTGFAYSKTNLIQDSTYKFVIWSKGLNINETEAYATTKHPTSQIDPKVDKKIQVKVRNYINDYFQFNNTLSSEE